LLEYLSGGDRRANLAALSRKGGDKVFNKRLEEEEFAVLWKRFLVSFAAWSNCFRGGCEGEKPGILEPRLPEHSLNSYKPTE
jgi:hypothetical protein